MPDVAITPEEYTKIREAMKNGGGSIGDVMARAANGSEVKAPELDAVGVAGHGLSVGNLTLFPPGFDVLLYLEMIDCPFIADGDGDVTLSDAMQAVYVIACGDEAVAPLFGVRHRHEALSRLEHLASQTPEHLAAYLKQSDAIAGARGEFERKAADFFKRIGTDVSFNEIVQAVQALLTEAFSAFEGLGDEKKTATASAGSAGNG